MTYELQQQIITVARYAGWERTNLEINSRGGIYIHPEKEHAFWLDGMHYHDRIEWIWPVAKRVCEELITDGLAKGDIYAARYLSICDALTDFDIPALFQSVFNAITFLNSLKESK